MKKLSHRIAAHSENRRVNRGFGPVRQYPCFFENLTVSSVRQYPCFFRKQDSIFCTPPNSPQVTTAPIAPQSQQVNCVKEVYRERGSNLVIAEIKSQYKDRSIIMTGGLTEMEGHEGGRRQKEEWEDEETGRRSRGGLCGIHLGLRRKE